MVQLLFCVRCLTTRKFMGSDPYEILKMMVGFTRGQTPRPATRKSISVPDGFPKGQQKPQSCRPGTV